MPQYRPVPQASFGGLNMEILNRFRPTMAIWGLTAGLGVSLYLSEVPLFQKDVLRKIPFVKSYFVDTTPDCDKPF